MSEETTFHQKMVTSFILKRKKYEDPRSCFPMKDDRRKLMRKCPGCGLLYDINGSKKSKAGKCTFHRSFFKVAIPSARMGLVTGREGENLKYIRMESEVFDVCTHLGAPKGKSEIQLWGGTTEVKKALYLISKTLAGKGPGGKGPVLDGSWDCCKLGIKAGGCATETGHSSKYFYCILDKSVVVTTQPKARATKVFALDCKMLFTSRGKEVTRVTLVDFAGETCYESLVKPLAGIKDYNTEHSGITKDMLESMTTTLAEVQENLIRLISADDILVGHMIDGDLRGLHLEHRKVKPLKMIIHFVTGC